MTETSTIFPTSELDPVDIEASRRFSLYERGGKRLFDVIVGLILAVVVLPLGLLIAAAVRVGLGSGVLYSQTRVGRDKKPFRIWKFRTMRPDRRGESSAEVENDRRTNHKTPVDPRHTGLGRTLRKLSLDELPQLWNVVRGEMSLVGPRPEVFSVAKARGYLDHPRHRVRPGMTGPYQVSPVRMKGDLRDGLDLDTGYVQRITLLRDVGLLFRTLGVMLRVGAAGS
ncbi:MAG: sugar transferase [Acidimicrobiales bacterium]